MCIGGFFYHELEKKKKKGNYDENYFKRWLHNIIFEIAKDISEGFARIACAGELNGKIADLRTVVSEDADLNIITANDAAGLTVIRHTAAHVMAEAVKRLFPEAKVTIGPAIAI